MDLVEKIRKEEEILCNIKDDEYDKWKFGDRDIYDKMAGQERVNKQKRYVMLLKNELYKIVNSY